MGKTPRPDAGMDQHKHHTPVPRKQMPHVRQRCHRCRGSGRTTCQFCGGSGKVASGRDVFGNQQFTRCSGCFGLKASRCSACAGQGML